MIVLNLDKSEIKIKYKYMQNIVVYAGFLWTLRVVGVVKMWQLYGFTGLYFAQSPFLSDDQILDKSLNFVM